MKDIRVGQRLNDKYSNHALAVYTVQYTNSVQCTINTATMRWPCTVQCTVYIQCTVHDKYSNHALAVYTVQ